MGWILTKQTIYNDFPFSVQTPLCHSSRFPIVLWAAFCGAQWAAMGEGRQKRSVPLMENLVWIQPSGLDSWTIPVKVVVEHEASPSSNAATTPSSESGSIKLSNHGLQLFWRVVDLFPTWRRTNSDRKELSFLQILWRDVPAVTKSGILFYFQWLNFICKAQCTCVMSMTSTSAISFTVSHHQSHETCSSPLI